MSVFCLPYPVIIGTAGLHIIFLYKVNECCRLRYEAFIIRVDARAKAVLAPAPCRTLLCTKLQRVPVSTASDFMRLIIN